jgi:hypothetical protein
VVSASASASAPKASWSGRVPSDGGRLGRRSKTPLFSASGTKVQRGAFFSCAATSTMGAATWFGTEEWEDGEDTSR